MQGKNPYKMFEEFDKTGVFPFTRKRIDLTLSVETINKPRVLSNKQKKPISRIIDGLV